MKLALGFCGLVLLALSSGCAAQRSHVTLDPVGPAQKASAFHPHQGSLIVYSDLTTNVNDPDHQWHSLYWIYRADGTLMEIVANRSGSFYQQPETIDLPPGRYTVSAYAVNSGKVSVPVVIADDSETIVDLNQEIWPEYQSTDDSWVRLPNGHIVGKKVAP